MTDKLPAVLPSGAIAPADSGNTLYIVPALIADLGGPAASRYVEFFAAYIRNPNTRRAYARACSRFFAWCEDRSLTLTTIRPFDVGEWVEQLQENHGAPGVKQQLAAVRMRWVIERSLAWLNRFRRLTIRYERRIDIHHAFTSIACSLICFRALQGWF